MSDEPVGLSLEDDGPTPDPTPAPPEPVAQAAPPDEPAAPEATPDVAVEGQKFVPLSAVLAEREALKAARAEAAALRQEVEAQRPFLDFVKNHPQLTQPVQPQAPQTPQEDPRAVEMAQRLALFKPDGTLDTDAGKRTLDLMRSVASEQAQQLVAPMQQYTAQQQSELNRQRVLQGLKTASGQAVSPDALDYVWRSMRPEDTANPQVAGLLGLIALGAQAAAQQPTPPAPPPVVMTEPSGGLPQSRPQVSDLGRRIAADRGRTEKQWADNMKGFAGKTRPSSLED